jgi:hypothetical protein
MYSMKRAEGCKGRVERAEGCKEWLKRAKGRKISGAGCSTPLFWFSWNTDEDSISVDFFLIMNITKILLTSPVIVYNICLA